MLDSFPDRNPAEVVIQNILFVKHPTEERFDPVIARYYPDNANSIEDFKDISYDGIPYDWSGKVDIWTYDERHFIGFLFEKGELSAHFRFGGKNTSNSRIQSDCQEITKEVTYSTVDADGVLTIHASTIKLTSCSGSGGYTPQGSDGSDYHDYERPTCCEDPITAPPRDVPPYDPPTIPSPSTIINQLTNPCASGVFKELSKGSYYLVDFTGLGTIDIADGILNFFEQSGKFEYRIQNGIIPQSTNMIAITGGKTERINGINTITLDNNYLKSATSLSIARTIIHETVHAYLLEHTEDREVRAGSSIYELVNEYFKKYPNKGDYHHAAMSDFVWGMTISLYNWDKKYGPGAGSLGLDYYYKLSLGGLLKSGTSEPLDEVKALIPSGSSWDEISQVLANEATGNYQANGEKCN